MSRYNVKIKYYDSGEIQIHTFPNGVDFDNSTLLSDHLDVLVGSSSSAPSSVAPSSAAPSSVASSSSDFSYLNSIRSIRRSKGLFFDYALNNKWDFFVTFTFDNLHDRYNLESCSSFMRKWLQNYKYKHCSDLKYLGTFEYHKDGAIHFHFLISGSNLYDLLVPCDLQVYSGMYYCPSYPCRNLWDPVRNTIAISCYMCKYISKQLGFILAMSKTDSNWKLKKEKSVCVEISQCDSFSPPPLGDCGGVSPLAPDLDMDLVHYKECNTFKRSTRFICSRNLKKPESREFFLSSSELPEGIDLGSYIVDKYFKDYKIVSVTNGRSNSSFIRLE